MALSDTIKLYVLVGLSYLNSLKEENYVHMTHICINLDYLPAVRLRLLIYKIWAMIPTSQDYIINIKSFTLQRSFRCNMDIISMYPSVFMA